MLVVFLNFRFLLSLSSASASSSASSSTSLLQNYGFLIMRQTLSVPTRTPKTLTWRGLTGLRSGSFTWWALLSCYFLLVVHMLISVTIRIPSKAKQSLSHLFNSFWKFHFIHSFIHSSHFYSASSSPLLLRGAPYYSTDTASEFHAEAHRQL